MSAVLNTERKIMKHMIRAFIEAGYRLGVHDGEELVVINSADKVKLFAAMRSVDEEKLIVYRDGERVGWVFLVYGNSGWDVVCDYTTNLEPVMEGVNTYAQKFED